MNTNSSYNLYQQLQPPQSHTYKVIQLTPQILASMLQLKPLYIKSSASKKDLTLVSDTQTWRLRQMDQTNTVLLMDTLAVDGSLVGIDTLPYEYETQPLDLAIDITTLPIYSQDSNTTQNSKITTINQLLEDTPVSEHEFYNQWYNLGGCEVDGVCYILDDATISKFLQTFLAIVITKKIDYKSQSIDISEFVAQLEDHGFHASIINSLTHRFCSQVDGDGDTRIDNEKIARWFGIQTLKSSRSFAVSDFYIQWKTMFPAFYSVPIDIGMLRGNFSRTGDRISYLNSQTLSTDIVLRIKELFKVNGEWELEDIGPYVEKFLPNKKLESALLKYAKVRKVGKRKIVCPR